MMYYISILLFLLGDLNDKNMIPFEPPPEGAHVPRHRPMFNVA